MYIVFTHDAPQTNFSESPEQMKLQGLIMHHVFGQPVQWINQSIDD